ncbi:hypothetical protein PtA15_12A460 [Puccinia triticina]|uniref:Secreted protein n=1 Tax=Puccinia triticina TaxID=208348 RepID=A0ABY7CYT0_9BASI|nr:uncharacterized protein PtA15_12A460 [Puccinia triticina]WAQ90471.1 hypothetical protein PtA15_12A460 [Puccinia triticina]
MHIRTSLALLISLQVVSQVASYWPPLRSKAQAHGGESSASDTGLSSARADASLGRSDFGRSSDYHPGGLGATSDDPSSAGSPAAGGTGSARTKNPSSKSGSSATLSESDSGSSSGGPYDGRAYQGQATTYDSKWSIGNAPIQFYNKNGASQYYTAIQVAGSNKPIKSLEARATGSSSDKTSRVGRGSSASGGVGDGQEGWIKLVRQSNSNHFGPPNGKGGLGTSADLRVTCDDGKQFVTKGVNLIDSTHPTPASGNCS